MKSWKDIKFKTAKELLQLEKEANLEAFDLMVRQLAILEDKSVADIEDLTPDQIFTKWKDWEFTKTMPGAKKVDRFKFNGIEYGMTPLDKITLAQMVDIEEFYKDGLHDNIENIVSVLFLPIKEKTLFGKIVLENYEFDEDRVKVMMEQDMEFVWSNLLFFWTGAKEYMQGLKDYLNQTEGEMKTIQIYNNILMIEAEMLRKRKEGLLKKAKRKLNQIFNKSGDGLA